MYIIVYLLFFSTLVIQNVDALYNPFKKGSTVATIGGITKKITKSTSCQSKNWGWKDDEKKINPCVCCVIKHSLKQDGTFTYTNKPLRQCKNKCDEGVLKALQENLAIDPTNEEEFVAKIIDQFGDIKVAHTTIEDYIVPILKKLYADGKIKSFEDCYKVISISGGGAQTLQLFLVKDCNNNPKYLVKELKKRIAEVKHIQRIRSVPELKSLIYREEMPEDGKGLPYIALNEVFATYKDTNNKPHTVAVLHAAPGEQLVKILQKFSRDYDDLILKKREQSEDSEEKSTLIKTKGKDISSMMEDFGRQLGNFHLLLMQKKDEHLTGYSGSVHGDMHANNIFIDRQHGNQVTFIDAETMAYALKKPRYVCADLRKFYVFASSMNKRTHQDTKGNIPAYYWHDVVMYPFLYGYIKAYAVQNDRLDSTRLNDVMQILKACFVDTFGTREKLLEVTLAPTVFGRAPFKFESYKRKYMKPMLNILKSNFVRKYSGETVES